MLWAALVKWAMGFSPIRMAHGYPSTALTGLGVHALEAPCTRGSRVSGPLRARVSGPHRADTSVGRAMCHAEIMPPGQHVSSSHW